jgi:hypothetical protein
MRMAGWLAFGVGVFVGSMSVALLLIHCIEVITASHDDIEWAREEVKRSRRDETDDFTFYAN